MEEKEKEILDKVKAIVNDKKVQRMAITGVIIVVLIMVIRLTCFTTWIEFNEDINLNIEYDSEYVDKNVTIVLGDRFTHHQILTSQAVLTKTWTDPANVDIRHELYSGSIWGHKSSIELTTTFVDTTPPDIILVNADAVIEVTSEGKFNEPGYRAQDSHDGDLTKQVEVSYTNDEILYFVTDASGNSTAVSRRVYHKDETAPIITLKGDNPYYLKVGDIYVEPGYTASDDTDGDMTGHVSITGGKIESHEVGLYTQAYSVVDTSGNSTVAVRNIVVTNVLPEEVEIDVNPKDENGNSLDKVIYLTFDNGPSKNTEKLLRILDKYGVKATFFVTNLYPDYNYVIRDIFDKGHSLGVLSYTVNDRLYRSAADYLDDFNQMQDIIIDQTGEPAMLYRFINGSSYKGYGSHRSIRNIANTLASEGYSYFDWNVMSGDDLPDSNANSVYEYVISCCEDKDICVILQHDDKGFSVNAVENIIQWGLDNGYTFLPLTSDTGIVHHPMCVEE